MHELKKLSLRPADFNHHSLITVALKGAATEEILQIPPDTRNDRISTEAFRSSTIDRRGSCGQVVIERVEHELAPAVPLLIEILRLISLDSGVNRVPKAICYGPVGSDVKKVAADII